MKDQERGLYNKYLVKRLDDDNGKHDNCWYFVLDLEHDKFAIPALEAYINACQKEFPDLVNALNLRIEMQTYSPDTPITFSFLIQAVLDTGINIDDLAGAFAVSSITIDRWASGDIVPGIAVRNQAIKKIKKVIEDNESRS